MNKRLLAIGAAVAAFAPAGLTADSASAAGCDVYRVAQHTHVYSSPDLSTSIKSKSTGDIVTYCGGAEATDPASPWQAVDLGYRGADGRGYMVESKLEYQGTTG